MLSHGPLIPNRTLFSDCLYQIMSIRVTVYLSDECTLVTAAGRRPLQSADNRTCLVKRSRNQFGDCCFATAGPTQWNSLPEQLWQPLDISNDRWKRLCLVSWAAAPRVWTL